MICFLTFLIQCTSSKLLASNTLQTITSLDIPEQNINLTIWIQVRFPMDHLESRKEISYLRIHDQFNVNQVMMNLELIDEFKLRLNFDLQNRSKENQVLHRDNITLQWQKITVSREGCFKRLQYQDINLSQACNNSFDAKLFLIQNYRIHVFVYDLEEFFNELINVNSIFMKENKYSLNTLKDRLVIKFYLKYYCFTRKKGVFFYFQLIENENFLYFQYNFNSLELFVKYTNQQLFKILTLELQSDQWLLFSLYFDVLNLNIQYNIDNENNEIGVEFENELNVTYSQYLNYQFLTIFNIMNSQTIVYKYMQIYSLVNNQKDNSCTPDCLFCLYNQCWDTEKNQVEDEISNEIKQSSLYQDDYFQNYEYRCNIKNYFLKNGRCIEYPKYKGQYCYNCHWLQKSINFLNDSSYLGLSIPINSYEYYMDSMYSLSEDQIEIFNGLKFENDLQLFIMTIKDIFLTYKLYDQVYCESGYLYKNNKCRMKLRKCLVQILTCFTCQNNYALVNNKCVKCQKNCLYCRLANNRITCILFQHKYYLSDKGIIQQCMNNSEIINCLSKDQAIKILQQKGYSFCQNYEIYDVKLEKCQDIEFYKSIFKFVQYYHTQDEQQLEIQDQLAEQQVWVDKQLYVQISLQQVNRLSRLVKEYNKLLGAHTIMNNFGILTQMNSSIEEMSIKKITLSDVKIFSDEQSQVIYQNKKYFDLIDIYKQLQIPFQIVQFDVVIYQQLRISKEEHYFYLDFEEYDNVTFIINISFDCNPSLFFVNEYVIFHFRAHEIIVQNLVFDKVNEESRKQNSLHLLDLEAENITISNILIQNVKLQKIFYLSKFKQLKMNNIWIIDSQIQDYFKSIKLGIQHQEIYISSIYAIRSNVSNFFNILDARKVVIQQIYYKYCQLQGNNFFIKGSIEYIGIDNLHVIEGELQKCKLVLALYQLRRVTYFYLSNVYFQKPTIVNSSIFLFKNAYQAETYNIHFKSLLVTQGNILDFENVFNLYIYNVSFNGLYIQGRFPLIFIQSDNYTLLKHFYIKRLQCISQPFIHVKGSTTISQNFNFYQVQLMQVDFIFIDSQNLDMRNFMFRNLSSEQGIEVSIRLLAFQKLSIRGLVFSKIQLIDTELIFFYSINYFYLRNLFLYDIDIKVKKQERLILFQYVFDNNFAEFIYLKSINITTQDKTYNLFQLHSDKFQCYFGMHRITIKNIINNKHTNTIFIIHIDQYELRLYFVKIVYTESINFLFSSSSKLILKYFQIFDIIRQFIDLQSFITQRSSVIKYDEERISISDIYVNRFQGIFLDINTDNKMLTFIKDISFDMTISVYQVFKLNQNTDTQAKLIVYRLLIANQNNRKSQISHYAFMETNFDVVILKSTYIYQSSKQFLEIYRGAQATIQDLYVIKYHSPDTLLFFDCEKYQFQLLLEKFTILDSNIQRGQVINLRLIDYKFFFHDIQFIDITVYDAAFKLESSSNEQNINFKNLLLKDVKSTQYLFEIKSQTNYYSSVIIGGESPQIFSDTTKQIGYFNGLVTNIIQSCRLTDDSYVMLNQSEIVNSNIIQHQELLIGYKSQFLGRINFKNQVIIAFSLNNGRSLFEQLVIQKNLYQVQFSKNNKFLHLPSGRDLQTYKYFNIQSRGYSKLYDSISYFSFYQTRQTQCLLKQNRNNQTIHERNLIILPGVNEIDNLFVTLNPYLKDQFIELDLVCNQSNQMITYRTLVKTFNCQLGEFLFKDQCILCNIEQYSYSVGYNQQFCQIMSFDIIEQLDIGQIKLHQEYWRHSYANKYIEQCNNQNCQGGWHTGDSSCKQGYVGALCSECDVYNTRGQGHFGKIDNQCSECYFDYSIFLKGLLLITFQLILIYISYYSNKQQSQQYLFLQISKRKFTQLLLRQNINQLTVLFKLYYDYLFTLYLLKDIINFGQFVDVSLNLVYNPSFKAVPQFDCLINQLLQYPIQYTQILLKIIVPVLILNLIVILYTFLIKFKKAKYSFYEIIACLLIINQQNQQIIFQSLIKLSLPIKYSNTYWTVENLSIQYYSKIHQYYLQVLIIPIVILITIINVAIFLWIRFINKRLFNNLKLSLFIYKQYKSEYYYWDYLKLSFIQLFMIILYSYDKTYVILTILLLTITHTYKPFSLQHFNQIDEVILLFSLYTYFGIIMYQKDDAQNKYIIIIVSNIILLRIYLKYFMHGINIQFRETKIKCLNQITNKIPFTQKYINTQKYYKNKYYMSVLKLSRKSSKAALTVIKTQESRQVTEKSVNREIEMAEVHGIQ